MDNASEPEPPNAAAATPHDFATTSPSVETAEQTVQKLAAARAGSREAMGALFDQFRNYLLLVASTAVGKGLQARIAASDLVQETILEAGQRFEHFSGDSDEQLLRWLTQILESRLANAVRRHIVAEERDASRDVDPGGLGETPVSSVVDTGSSPVSIVSADDESRRIRAAIAHLADDHRRVIELRSYQALPFDEVGREMGRTPEAARKLFGRAIEELRIRIRPNDSRSGPS